MANVKKISGIEMVYHLLQEALKTSKEEYKINPSNPLYSVITDLELTIMEVKKINKQVLPLEYELLKTISFEENFNNTQNFVLDGKDNFTIDFYEKHKIKINETLWKQIYGALV